MTNSTLNKLESALEEIIQEHVEQMDLTETISDTVEKIVEEKVGGFEIGADMVLGLDKTIEEAITNSAITTDDVLGLDEFVDECIESWTNDKLDKKVQQVVNQSTVFQTHNIEGFSQGVEAIVESMLDQAVVENKMVGLVQRNFAVRDAINLAIHSYLTNNMDEIRLEMFGLPKPSLWSRFVNWLKGFVPA